MTSAELARLDELAPIARPWFEALIRAMQARGHDPYIGTVWRSAADQKAAIAAGRTSKHQRLSWHMFETNEVNPDDRKPASRAIDFRRRLPNGTCDTMTSGPDVFWRALYEEATRIPGMRSLAYHPDGSKVLLNGRTWDPGHVEFRGDYETLADAMTAESPGLLNA